MLKQSTMQARLVRRIRIWIVVFIVGLVLSGVTAFPLETELRAFATLLDNSAIKDLATTTHLLPWIEHVRDALIATNASYPFLGYGTDWLAFAHLVIAVAFIGPYLDPARNRWTITWGLIACIGVLPLALIAGPIRGIPFAWRCIDSSFGIFGCIPLFIVRRDIDRLAALASKTSS